MQAPAASRTPAWRAPATLVVALALAGHADGADPRAGARKANACVACHGADGIATLPNAPNLAGQPAPYVSDQLRQFRNGKRASEVMAVIAKPLSDADIDDLAAWYESIRIEARMPP
jgi:cytochrome c553